MKSLSGVLFISLIFANCSKSLVYSPSLNLPNKVLQEKEIDFQGGVELMPETRPETLGGNQTTLGINGQLSYGFSDKFNLSVKGWADVKNREFLFRSGYSIHGQIIRAINLNTRIIILPRLGIALNGNEIEGYGLGSSIVYHKAANKKLGWYSGVGLVWGFRYLEKERNANMEEKLPMGIGVMGNLGFAYEIIAGFRLNCELNPIYQVNTFDENNQFLLSPTIGFGYTLRRKSE